MKISFRNKNDLKKIRCEWLDKMRLSSEQASQVNVTRKTGNQKPNRLKTLNVEEIKV